MLTSLFLIHTLLFPGSSTAAHELLTRGDLEFSRLQYAAAIARYDSALNLEPENTEALWRLMRVYVTLGEVAPHTERETLYRKAEQYGRLCVKADSSKAECHTWLAAALGNIALFVGGSTKIELANEIKAELEKALALRTDDDATYSILGSFYHAVGTVSWLERQLAWLLLGNVPDGGFEESEAAYNRAIELAPDVPRHRYELGMLYVDWGRKEDALEMFESALKLPITAAGDTVARKRMFELIGDLK